MIVVIDTNQFYGDMRLRRRDFRVVLGQHQRKKVRVVVPEVVVREVPKMFAQQYRTAHDQLARAAANLREIDFDARPSTLPDAGVVRDEYEEWLRKQLAARRVEVAPLPDTSLDELVQRSVEERRPFRADSKGFRDAVIWETVKNLAAEDDVVLISKNSKDFAESDKRPDELHSHLREDLTVAGLAEDRVRLIPDLTTFIDKHVPPVEKAAETAKALLKKDDEWEEELSTKIRDALVTFSLDGHDTVTVVDAEDVSIDNVTLDDSVLEAFEIVGAVPIDEAKGLVSLEVEAHAVLFFSFTAELPDAERLVEQNADAQIDFWEETWAQGSTNSRHVSVMYALDFDVNTHDLGDPEKVMATDD